ncbi:MAG: hypothetical protein R3C24_00440 [Cyanobacteriota/Melainabacteria group bacterium]
MLDLIKAEDPELYNNKDLNMEDLHGRSSSWWRPATGALLPP